MAPKEILEQKHTLCKVLLCIQVVLLSAVATWIYLLISEIYIPLLLNIH